MKKQKWMGIWLVALMMAIPSVAFAVEKVSPLGYWEVIDESGEIRSVAKLYIRDGALCGKLVKLVLKPGDERDPRCQQCPGGKKNQPMLGLEFIWGFSRSSGSRWEGGRLLDPETGKVYRGWLEVTADGKRLEVFGYIRVVVRIGRRQIWIRTSKDRHPDVIE